LYLDESRFGLLPISEVADERLADFSCGVQELDDFLKAAARDFHSSRLGYTTVVFHEDLDGPVGYFTLANDAIPLKASEVLELECAFEVRLTSFPAVKLCKLAVSNTLHGNGAGASILRFVLASVLDGSGVSASRFVTVDAKHDERVVRFYRSNGFERSLWAESHAASHSRKKNTRAKTVKMICDVLKRQTASDLSSA
jgi:GNAT superfamily N-acetyltransferase